MNDRYTIGILIGNANSPYSTDLMQGIMHAAEKMDANLLFYLGVHSSAYSTSPDRRELDDYEYQFNVVYDYVQLSGVDALIVSYGTMSHFLENVKKEEFLKRYEGIPYVVVEDEDETGRESTVIGNNYGGMYEIVEHLVLKHHYKKILFLSGPVGTKDADQRRRAYLDVMKKYGLPFDESYLAYGDYTVYVEPQVRQLLDRHPDAEAVVCANDMMADTVYRVCRKRGITVGKDLAVTGYDDWKNAQYMNPPLTTVFQNAYNMGYTALGAALELCREKKAACHIVPSTMKIRNSCGCIANSNKARWETVRNLQSGRQHSDTEAEQFLNRIFVADSNHNMKERVGRLVEKFLSIEFESWKVFDQVTETVEEFLDESIVSFISLQALLGEVNRYLDSCMMRNSAATGEEYTIWLQMMLDLKNNIHDRITSHAIQKSQDAFELYKQETWYLPLISREMLGQLEDEQEFFRVAMERIMGLGIKKSYLYLFDEPIRHTRDDICRLPEKMYLAASQNGKHVSSFRKDARPCITREQGLAMLFCGTRAFQMQVYVLFSGEMQYGILVTDVPIDDIPLAYLASMQISNSLRFYEMSLAQRRTRSKLERLVEEINEKNEVLNFISGNDVMTGCLNRRGFMEAAVRMNKDNKGESAALIFLDLDHLKEINDFFGHKEGDFAIVTVASTFLKAVSEHGIVGRIGGDEFVAMVLEKDRKTGEIIRFVREQNDLFNKCMEKPYYVEASMGVRRFVCSESMVLSEVLDKADAALYRQKKERRKTIRREIPV